MMPCFERPLGAFTRSNRGRVSTGPSSPTETRQPARDEALLLTTLSIGWDRRPTSEFTLSFDAARGRLNGGDGRRN